MPHHHLSAGSVEAPRPEPSATQLAALRLDLTEAQRARLTAALGRAIQIVLDDDEDDRVVHARMPVVIITEGPLSGSIDVDIDGKRVANVYDHRIGWNSEHALTAIRRIVEHFGATVVEIKGATWQEFRR